MNPPNPSFLYFCSISIYSYLECKYTNFSPSQATLWETLFGRGLPYRFHIFSCQIQLVGSVVNQHFEVVEEVVAYHTFGA
jgi:hypothetical protein